MPTTPNFWECDCDDGFIHVKTCPHCTKCGALNDWGQPDAHEGETGVGGNMAPCASSHVSEEAR